MRKWAEFFIVGVACLWPGPEAWAGGHPNPAAPKWTIDLKQKFDFQAFDRPISFRWTLHQDVVFLSPERLLVYQVNRSRTLAPLAPRDASGGGGNFILDMRILSARDGHEIKSLRLTTNADSTKVIATREGRFLVRTGEILYLYSSDFEQIAAKPLPLRHQVAEEGWQIDASPSGTEVALLHQEVFKRDPMSPVSAVERASVDVEILKEENLQTVRNFSLPWFIASWSAGEHVLITSQPWPGADPATFGLLDYDGNWSPLLFAWYSPSQPCAYRAAALDLRFYVTYGCGTLSVFPQNGRTVFNLKNGKEYVGSVKGSGSNLAIQLEKRFTRVDNAANIAIPVVKPLRIDVYEMKNHRPMLSAPVHGERAYYALTAQGSLAVVDGTLLAFYQPGP
jgi:hypothetical protein